MPVHEGDQARAACNEYILMPKPRSLKGLADSFKFRRKAGDDVPTINLSVIREWSHCFKWLDRAEEWDRRIEAEALAAVREELVALAIERRRERLEVAKELRDIGMLALREKAPEKIPADAAVKAIHEANDMERKDLGEDVLQIRVAGTAEAAITGPIPITLVIDKAEQEQDSADDSDPDGTA